MLQIYVTPEELKQQVSLESKFNKLFNVLTQ